MTADIFLKKISELATLSDIDLLSLDKLAKKWDVGTDYLRDQIQNGDLIASKIGRKYFVTPKNVKKFIDHRQYKAPRA